MKDYDASVKAVAGSPQEEDCSPWKSAAVTIDRYLREKGSE